jgi:hypothetical protein
MDVTLHHLGEGFFPMYFQNAIQTKMLAEFNFYLWMFFPQTMDGLPLC